MLGACPPQSAPRWRAMLGAVGRARQQWPDLSSADHGLPEPRLLESAQHLLEKCPQVGASPGFRTSGGPQRQHDHSNSLSSFQLPFQSSEYLKTEGLGAPVTLARKYPLTLAALPWPRRQPQRLKSLWQAAYGGRIYQLCFAFVGHTVVLPLLPFYDR